MKISVVVPVYNEEEYLGLCLAAMVDQTVKPYEIIVVDNNSTDNSAKIAKKFGARVIHEKRQGITFARNAGFNAAESEVIARTDADSIPDRKWIENISKHVTAGQQALTGPIFYDFPLMDKRDDIYFMYQRFMRMSLGQYVFTGPNMVIKKDLWLKVAPLTSTADKKVHEDVDLSIVTNKFAKIYYNYDVIMNSSSRRAMNNPASFFIEYQFRMMRMVAKENFNKVLKS